MKRRKLYLEERLAVARERLNGTKVGESWTAQEWHRFAVHLMGLLDTGHIDFLTEDESERLGLDCKEGGGDGD